MKIILLILVLACGLPCKAQKEFNRYFEEKSMRIDFALNGNTDSQSASLLQIREEPIWGGPKKNLIDNLFYGGYYVKVYDKVSGSLIYSRGLNTLFEEWRTTEQAVIETQSWYNSISIPFPKAEVEIEILARDKQDMSFRSLLKWSVKPNSIFIDRGKMHNNKVVNILQNGDPAQKVDLVFLAEGYTISEEAKFEADAKRFAEALFKTPPFDKRKDDFNVSAVCLVSEESGTDMSGKGVFKNTALNSGFYTFGVDRYLTTSDMKSIRDAVWDVPCDAIYILVNTPVYGGGGMYNLYAIGASDNDRTTKIFAHEFGHSLAGLADEYFNSETAYDEASFYNIAQEPWEPNITTLVDFDKKWKSLLPANTPVPTPLKNEFKNKIGVFEGGGYLSKGIYRPMNHCMMRDFAPFCPACQQSIDRVLNFLTDKEY